MGIPRQIARDPLRNPGSSDALSETMLRRAWRRECRHREPARRQRWELIQSWRREGFAQTPMSSGGGRGGGIRTHDLMLPKHVRCQAALHPDGSVPEYRMNPARMALAPRPSAVPGPWIRPRNRASSAQIACAAHIARASVRVGEATPSRSDPRSTRSWGARVSR